VRKLPPSHDSTGRQHERLHEMGVLLAELDARARRVDIAEREADYARLAALREQYEESRRELQRLADRESDRDAADATGLEARIEATERAIHEAFSHGRW
jgi:hypothetical protein